MRWDVCRCRVLDDESSHLLLAGFINSLCLCALSCSARKNRLTLSCSARKNRLTLSCSARKNRLTLGVIGK